MGVRAPGAGDALGDAPSDRDDESLASLPRGVLYHRGRWAAGAPNTQTPWGFGRVRILRGLKARVEQMDRARAVMLLTVVSLISRPRDAWWQEGG